MVRGRYIRVRRNLESHSHIEEHVSDSFDRAANERKDATSERVVVKVELFLAPGGGFFFHLAAERWRLLILEFG